MESNKNDNNNNGDNEHDQTKRTAQKRTYNELTNDEDKPAEAAGQEDQECANSKKNREEGNDLLDLELESLSREDLVKLVRKQMQILNQNDETIKQLETTKKEAEESAKKAEEFSHQIVEMHKEVEEKAGELAEKAKQIDALLMQLNEHTSHQQLMPTEQEMKIKLSLETWYDWLGFVPRHQLGKIVPIIGDRRFASIIQKFLHEYGEITIADITIVAPYEEDPIGHPRVRVFQNNRNLRFEMAEAQMPANIKTFNFVELSYFDHSVLNFMQKFQQNGLLDNVNLWFNSSLSKDTIQPVLRHLLPLINGINSIEVSKSAQLIAIYNAGNSKENYELNMKMMEETRIFSTDKGTISSEGGVLKWALLCFKNLHPTKIDLYCRWLYQTARADGKPRVFLFVRENANSGPVSLFIDRIKMDFLKATNPVTFFIRIILPKAFQPLEGICLNNGQTEERLQTKMEKAKLLISRYPLASTKKWIDENEKEVLSWDISEYNDRTIYLSKELKVVPI